MKFNFMMKAFLVFLFLLPGLSHAERLKILTWNVFMLPKPIKFSLQKERTPLIIDKILKNDSDIVFLQEAFHGAFLKEVLKKTSKTYPHQFYLGRQPGSLTVYGSGVYIMSRFPMTILRKVYFDDCAKADCFASKGSFVAEVTMPDGKRLHFAPTHLQSGGKENAEAIRFKQLQDINLIITLGTQNGVPQFLIGDLNIDALQGEEFHRAISYMNMTSTPLEGEPGHTNGFPVLCYPKPGNDEREWIDHVWLNPMSSNARVISKRALPFHGVLKDQECPLSDHYAVEAVIQI